MFLKYKNLTIRNAEADDAAQLALWWNDGRIMEHAGFPNGTGHTPESIADDIKSDTDETHRQLIIEIDNIAVGEMSYRNKGHNIAEIGIKICDFSKQNKGFGKVLLSMLISSLFNDLGYNKIILNTNINNKRAQHVYEELGFKKLHMNKNSWTNQIEGLEASIDYELEQIDFCSFAK